MNCIVIDDEPASQEILVSYIDKIPMLLLAGVYENALDAIAVIEAGKVDLVFCDIHMPDIDGITFLKTLNSPPLFIFVTGNPIFAIESFELNALDYILKPFTMERILKSVNKARTIMDRNKHNMPERKYLIIKDRSSNVILPHDEIFYLKSDKDYVKIATLEKDYLIWNRISDMEDCLSAASEFVRVQKSYIVNLNFVRKITGNVIVMKGELDDIPLGGQYRDELFKHLGIPVKA